MIYSVPGKPWITYRIGDTVEIVGGSSGKVVKRYKPNPKSTTLVDILTDSNETVTCPEHHIRKGLLNNIPWRSE